MSQEISYINDAMESDPDDILTEKSPPKKHNSYAEIEVRPGRRKGAFSASVLIDAPWGHRNHDLLVL